MKKQKTPIPNRKGRTPPRGLNVRGLPRTVETFLRNTAKARGLSTEAYVRSEIIKHVDEKLNPQVAPVPGYNIGPPTISPGPTVPYVYTS